MNDLKGPDGNHMQADAEMSRARKTGQRGLWAFGAFLACKSRCIGIYLSTLHFDVSRHRILYGKHIQAVSDAACAL